MSELTDHLVLALFDFLLTKIDRRRDRRRLRRLRAELASAHEKSGGHEAGAKSEAQDAARTFISYLTRPASKEKFAAAGLDYR